MALLSVMAQQAEEAGKDLKAYTWGGNAAPAPAPGAPLRPPRGRLMMMAPPRPEELLDSVNMAVKELDRLIRQHPQGRGFAVAADMILKEKEARTLASESQLQKVAVSLDTTARLLELLVRANDQQDRHKARLEKIGDDRRRDLAAAPNVIEEIRDAAYHELLLWDLLLWGGP